MITDATTAKQPKKECNVFVAITPALLGAIDRIAATEELSRSAVIRRALSAFVKQNEKASKV